MSKVAFFYANGTSYLINVLDFGITIPMPAIGGGVSENAGTATIAGLRGRTATWDLAPQNDCFPALLDPDKFTVTRIRYPADSWPMSASIDYGVAETIARINALPAGQPFALGGYSQGAAVMSGVYNEIRYGSLTSRASSFLGAINFGNPRRQLNHLGLVGGTNSGSWDSPGSVSGGKGAFPATGPYARLQNCEDKWCEFSSPRDIFSAVGSTTEGNSWSTLVSQFITLNAGGLINFFLTGGANQLGNVAAVMGLNTFTDALGVLRDVGGGGHTEYPFIPQEGNPFGGLTSYQVALAYLEILADEWATAPVVLNPSTAGWSTTLLPPAI